MGKRKAKQRSDQLVVASSQRGRPSALLDTRVIYCSVCLDQLWAFPDGCVDRPHLRHRCPHR